MRTRSARGFGIAPAERELHPLRPCRRSRRRGAMVQSDQVPHDHVGAEVAAHGPVTSAKPASGRRAWRAAPPSRPRAAPASRRSSSRTSSAGSPSSSVTRLPSAPAMVRAGAIGRQPWVTRHQLHAFGESHARQAAAEHAARLAVTLEVAVAADGELHHVAAAGGQSAEQVAGGGAVRHLRDQLGDVGRPRPHAPVPCAA